jgi:hypothetical protein
MELFGRRRDRWDWIVAAAAATLIVFSYQPWFVIGTFVSVNTRTAWDASQWSQAVMLGTLAAGIHLAYRGRTEARGAVWLVLVLLVVAIGLTGWEWHQALNTKFGEGIIYFHRAEPGFVPNPYRSDPQWGLYAGAGSLVVMFAAIARRLVPSRLRRASAS